MNQKPLLIYTVGYPGAGKTTFAECLSSHLGFVHLCADTVAFASFTLPTYSPEEAKILYTIMKKRAMNYLKLGYTVVYDAAVNRNEKRSALVDLAYECQATPIGMWIYTPREVARQRCACLRPSPQMRIARVVPEALFNRHVTAFERPNTHAESIIRIPGTAKPSKQLSIFQDALARLTAAQTYVPSHSH